MPQPNRCVDKRAVLRQQGVLNLHPEAVVDALFHGHPFFDPRDIVQVKYEMLRRVHVQKQSIRQAAIAFGFSRPTFYQAQVAFRRYGWVGLVPHKRGPRQAHQLAPAIMDFLETTRVADVRLSPRDLAQRVAERFGVHLDPRSLARGLRFRKKKPRPLTRTCHLLRRLQTTKS